MAYVVFIRGIPENKQVKDVRVHSAPGVNTDAPFRIKVGAEATCREIKPDPDSSAYQGQIYRWFHLTFGDGRDGWVRDDLLDLQGDCSPFGYGTYASRTYAFTAGSSIVLATPGVMVTVTPTQPSQPAQPTMPGSPGVSVTVTPIQPTQPAQPPTTTVPPITVTIGSTLPATPTAPITPVTTGCDGNVRSDARARVRAAPSLNSAQVGSVNPGGAVRILGVEPGQDGLKFRWMKVSANGVSGYIREDLLIYSDDCTAQGLFGSGTDTGTSTTTPPTTNLNPQRLFLAPIRQRYVIFQEYGVNRHKGVDLDVDVGTPIVASGVGVVAFLNKCTKCTADKPNFMSQGLPLWDPVAINDPAWGYGFGNAVIVRYGWADLPSSMREVLTGQNLPGGNAYVIHGHLSRINVVPGAIVREGTVLGYSGNTGNSSGPHLHLEVRLSKSPNETSYVNRVVVNPHLMYQL
jgi:murein DD-endopeptidase MepM/ murein hydrolase activator NlpD